MGAHWFELTVAVLATWRVAHMVAREDGPWDVVLRLRSRAGNGMAGRLMDCPYCLSVWIATPVLALFDEPWAWRVALWLATSGGACLIERIWETRAARLAGEPIVKEGGDV